MTRQPRAITLFLSVCFLPGAFASDDPCIQALMKVQPGQAAALAAKRDGHARPSSFRSTDKALEGENNKKNNDAQMKPEWAADALETSGDWHSGAAPIFGAGAMDPKADPKTRATLIECQSRRSQQGQKEKEAAAKNRKIAEKARTAEGNENNLKGYTPDVTHVAENSSGQESTSDNTAVDAALSGQLAELRPR